MALATGGVKNRSRNEVAISRGRLFAGVWQQEALTLARSVGARNGAGGSERGEGFPPLCPQKLETTAVKTSLMVAGLLAEYSAPLEASAIRRSVAVSASWP